MAELNPIKAVSNLFKSLAPSVPKMAKPKAMPTADSEAVEAARRRSIAEMQTRGGRQSTILTNDDRLG